MLKVVQIEVDRLVSMEFNFYFFIKGPQRILLFLTYLTEENMSALQSLERHTLSELATTTFV